jgi:putative peptidoglycan lipid II flippase
MGAPPGGSSTAPPPTAARPPGAAAALVAAGIFSSRFVGLLRERALATYFGTGLHADVFSAGLRLPNVLQNLLGEGTLSASFIPAYSALLGQGRTKDAGRVAGAMFALLLAIAGVVALVGIVAAPLLVSVFTPGFTGQRRELMIAVVRILFPMTGVLVLSAWALGILNSHRHFFVPYFAPVLWNAAIIGTLVAFGSRLELDALLLAAAWGALAGGVLQFLAQLPTVRRLDREIRLNTGRGNAEFVDAVRKAGPAVLGRGVVQVSAYVDMVLASLLAIGAVARLRYAQTLYVLPVSLFGMSVAAAELPELSRHGSAPGDDLQRRTVAAVQRVAFFVVPCAVAFVAIGDTLVAGLYRAGQFSDADVRAVWFTLAAYSLGLIASTSTRVYQSAFFALRDTATPARVAALRVLAALVAGGVLMVQFEGVAVLGIRVPAGLFADLSAGGVPLGSVGLALGAAVGAWLEWWLLRGRLARRVGPIDIGAALLLRLLGSAVAGAAAARTAVYAVALPSVPAAVAAAAVFGMVYLAATRLLGVPESASFVAGVVRRLRRR